MLTRPLLSIALLAISLRVGVRLHQGENDFFVNAYSFYLDIADSIVAGEGVTFHGRPPFVLRGPVYPAFLAAFTWGHKHFLPLVLAHAAIGAATVLCGALLAAELFGPPAAVITALCIAVYPYYVMHDVRIQDTSLFTFLTALSVLLVVRARRTGSSTTAAAAGITLGLDALARSSIVPFALVPPLWLAGFSPGAPRQRWRTAAIFTVSAAVVVTPWLIRSLVLLGQPAFTSESGYLLWCGNNPYTFPVYPRQSIDVSTNIALEHLVAEDPPRQMADASDERAVDAYYRRKATEYMRNYPWRTLWGGLRKLAAAFSVWPNPEGGLQRSLTHLFSYGPLLVLALLGALRSRHAWREHVIVYALFLSFVPIAFVFFAHTSHRAYLDVYLAVFASPVLIRFRVVRIILDKIVLTVPGGPLRPLTEVRSGNPQSQVGAASRNKLSWHGSLLGRR